MRTDTALQRWWKLSNLGRKAKKWWTPVVVSFFTEGFYTREAFELLRDLQRHSLDYDLQQVPNSGDWLENVNFKSEFILKMAERYPKRAILWLDSDSRVRSFPYEFQGLSSAEVAYRKIDVGQPCDAVVWLAAGEQRVKFIRKWIDLVKADPLGQKLPLEQAAVGAPTQYYFEQAVAEEFLSVHLLDESYCYLWDFSLDRQGTKINVDYVPVIEQMQANRLGKKLVQK